MTINTTLNRIRAKSPCKAGWAKLLANLGKTTGDDDPLPFSVILTSNGLEDALWCCRCEPQYAREWRLYAVWCARQVQHLMIDPRSIAALDVAERHACGLATGRELTAAWDAARDAARGAAWAAARAAWTAAWVAVWDAAGTEGAARAAAGAAGAAAGAAWDAGAAAGAAAWAAQTTEFLRVVSQGTPQ